MGKLRFYFALWAAKLSVVALKVTKRNGTNFPGKLAVKLCPDFLKYIGKPGFIIAITGTNGKTTTSNMVCDILESRGERIIHNRMGSNILSGVCTSLIRASGFTGKCRYGKGVFEVDERSSLLVYPSLQPDYIVCTNLVRDSCRRNAHPHYIFDIINRGIPKKTKLILNADDMISSRLGKDNEKVYYSIDRLPGDKERPFNIINDMAVCPECHSHLEYDYVRYNHIGRVRCPACGRTSPRADFLVTEVDGAGKALTVNENGGVYTYPLISDSVFHVYDQLAAIALLRTMGLTNDELSEAMKPMKIVGSRYREDVAGGIKVISHMAKGQNAPACSTVFDSVRNAAGEKEVVLAIEDLHDNIETSENISFIYDVDFEFLGDDSIKRVVVVGKRAKDMYLRMLLAGIPEDRLFICSDDDKIADYLTYTKGRDIYLLYELYQIPLYKKLWGHIIRRLKETGGEQ
jgi:UDP-N-acetylmuramyl tripeptide synthase